MEGGGSARRLSHGPTAPPPPSKSGRLSRRGDPPWRHVQPRRQQVTNGLAALAALLEVEAVGGGGENSCSVRAGGCRWQAATNLINPPSPLDSPLECAAVGAARYTPAELAAGRAEYRRVGRGRGARGSRPRCRGLHASGLRRRPSRRETLLNEVCVAGEVARRGEEVVTAHTHTPLWCCSTAQVAGTAAEGGRACLDVGHSGGAWANPVPPIGTRGGPSARARSPPHTWCGCTAVDLSLRAGPAAPATAHSLHPHRDRPDDVAAGGWRGGCSEPKSCLRSHEALSDCRRFEGRAHATRPWRGRSQSLIPTQVTSPT